MKRATSLLVPGRPTRHEDGSVVVVVLFLCLGLAVMAQILVGVVMYAQQGLADEQEGRRELARKEWALTKARDRALHHWAPASWEEVGDGSPLLEIGLVRSPVAAEWLLQASAKAAAGSPLVLSALIERGRDGLDLPLAALVAEEVFVLPQRSTPWLVTGSDHYPARGYLMRTATVAGVEQNGEPAGSEDYLVGPGCVIEPLNNPWRLDEGWLKAVESWAGDEASGQSSPGLCVWPTDGVVIINSSPGQTVRPPGGAGPVGAGGMDSDHPVVLIVCGGGSLDLSYLGDLWGVVVADGGAVKLDGTLLHGALFATQEVDLGGTGTVSYEQTILRWATDRSLWRARLLPGSRKEHLE